MWQIKCKNRPGMRAAEFRVGLCAVVMEPQRIQRGYPTVQIVVTHPSLQMLRIQGLLPFTAEIPDTTPQDASSGLPGRSLTLVPRSVARILD